MTSHMPLHGSPRQREFLTPAPVFSEPRTVFPDRLPGVGLLATVTAMTKDFELDGDRLVRTSVESAEIIADGGCSVKRDHWATSNGEWVRRGHSAPGCVTWLPCAGRAGEAPPFGSSVLRLAWRNTAGRNGTEPTVALRPSSQSQERYYTGTVFPGLISSDGFTHLGRF